MTWMVRLEGEDIYLWGGVDAVSLSILMVLIYVLSLVFPRLFLIMFVV